MPHQTRHVFYAARVFVSIIVSSYMMRVRYLMSGNMFCGCKHLAVFIVVVALKNANDIFQIMVVTQ